MMQLASDSALVIRRYRGKLLAKSDDGNEERRKHGSKHHNPGRNTGKPDGGIEEGNKSGHGEILSRVRYAIT